MFTRKRYAAFSLLIAAVMALSFVAAPGGAALAPAAGAGGGGAARIRSRRASDHGARGGAPSRSRAAPSAGVA